MTLVVCDCLVRREGDRLVVQGIWLFDTTTRERTRRPSRVPSMAMQRKRCAAALPFADERSDRIKDRNCEEPFCFLCQCPSGWRCFSVEAHLVNPAWTQVTVRRAALSAMSALLTYFPADSNVCGAWVRSALPLVRDPEPSVQDSVLDAFHHLLVDTAAAAGAGGSGGAASAAEAARPLLAALSAVGRSAGTCVAKLCAMLAAKQKLKGKQVRPACLLVQLLFLPAVNGYGTL